MKLLSQITRKLPFFHKLYALYDQVQRLETHVYELQELINECTISKDPRRSVLEYDYLRKTGRILDLNHPRTFNEKLQWLKLYDNPASKTPFVDKYRVRDWIRDQFGEQYLIPLLGAWNHFDEIDFSLLPDRFVIKPNNGSGDGVIVRNRQTLDIPSLKQHFDRCLSSDYAKRAMELCYHGIRPKILAEKLIEDNGKPLYDYKFICIHGKAVYCWIDIDRFTDHRRNIYDMNWERQPFTIQYPSTERTFSKPENFEKMIEIAERCSAPFIHVRVDLYNIGGKIFFSEMTFFSGGGYEKFTPEKYDRQLGELIHLPDINSKEFHNG